MASFVLGVGMFVPLMKSLKSWEKQTGKRIDLVFFATIYDPNFESFRYFRLFFHYPWSGIYLHARSFRLPGSKIPLTNCMPCPEKIFTLPSMSSVCVLDEGVVEPMKVLTNGKPVYPFPDITVTELENQSLTNTLATKLLDFANGRTIVVCMGHLKKTKGLLELCQAARDERLNKVCFFFGGEVGWEDMTRREKELITKTWEQSPNVLTHLTRLTDETINTVIKASDIVFAAYTDFPNSSNMMTKAAFFHRPIIVSEGHLMAERVRKYQTGKIVPEGDVDAIIDSILEIAHSEKSNEGHAEFYANHSQETLLTVLKKVVDKS